jgi:GNAT superfamily N-acetyltransferase
MKQPINGDDEAAVRIVNADLRKPEHERAILALTDAYSRDAYGDGKPLKPEVRKRLIRGLRKHPTTLVVLAFDGKTPVGSAVCFLGFSTFSAKPLSNIHDFFVLSSHRGRGVARKLLAGVERNARKLGCCKLTLEVMNNNSRALRTYETFGFTQYVLQAAAGQAIFMTKPLR